MTLPDFEFQLGRNRILKGRGWRGLLALGLLLITCTIIVAGGSAFVAPIRVIVAYLGL